VGFVAFVPTGVLGPAQLDHYACCGIGNRRWWLHYQVTPSHGRAPQLTNLASRVSGGRARGGSPVHICYPQVAAPSPHVVTIVLLSAILPFMHVRLQAAPDHVERLARESDPVNAVIEMIWNALDADADAVAVYFRRNEAGGIDGVDVQDDGRGIPPQSVQSEFERIGGSWKLRASRTVEKARPLHGRSGQGRLRAFALGSRIRWTTVAADPTGIQHQTIVSGSIEDRTDFEISDPEVTDESEGTLFEAWGKQSEQLDRLGTGYVRDQILITFAPYLLDYQNVLIDYDGTALDPLANVADDTLYDISFGYESHEETASLRIIEWQKGNERRIVLCGDGGIPVDDFTAADLAPEFVFTAYVTWPRMTDHQGDYLFAESEASPIHGLVEVVRRRVRDHFELRREERRRELVEQWKSRKVYPYERDATSPAEQAEQAAFDVVATSIGSHITGDREKQRLTLSLLKNSLQHDPSHVVDLIDEVLSLPEDEVLRLRRLLERTTLSRIIRASSDVTGRLDFLTALEYMVFDDEGRDAVRERAHLHKILENELWVFGEQFNLMISERGLTTVLEQHRHSVGLDSASDGPVEMLDGRRGRVDLMLSTKAEEHERIRHLVVELKAPNVVATTKELDQIKRYAYTVAADPRFARVNAIWDFWLVVSDLDRFVKLDARQKGRPEGVVAQPGEEIPGAQVTVWVRTWSEIITDSRRRLAFFKDRLTYDPSVQDAIDYLRREHGDVLPAAFMNAGTAGNGAP
jgi:hypothetical protein